MKEIKSLEGNREKGKGGICMGVVCDPFSEILVSLSGKVFLFLLHSQKPCT